MSNVGASVGSRRTGFDSQTLMIAERTRDGLINPKIKEMVENMDVELTDVIEDFMRAVDVETLGLAKRSGKRALPRMA